MRTTKNDLIMTHVELETLRRVFRRRFPNSKVETQQEIRFALSMCISWLDGIDACDEAQKPDMDEELIIISDD